MPSHQRSSPTSGRKEESADTLREQLTDTISKLNKLQAHNDKLESERDDLREKLLEEKDNYAALLEHWVAKYNALEAKHDDLKHAYESLKNTHENAKASPAGSMNSSLPDRTRDSRTSRRDRDERDRAYEKEREREKREKKERKAEKEQTQRLEQRFEERPDRARPPTSKRRSSHIEPFGSGRRSASANPLNRRSSGRVASLQVAQGPYTPRTANPHSSTGLYSSGSSAVYDDERDDGNYHMHSIR